jgi:hypothetical protein
MGAGLCEYPLLANLHRYASDLPSSLDRNRPEQKLSQRGLLSLGFFADSLVEFLAMAGDLLSNCLKFSSSTRILSANSSLSVPTRADMRPATVAVPARAADASWVTAFRAAVAP